MLIMKQSSYSDKANYISTFLFTSVTCIIAILVPNVTTIIAILGGACSVTLAYTFPLYGHVKLSKHPWTHQENFVPLMFFIPLIIIGYSSVVATVFLVVTG